MTPDRPNVLLFVVDEMRANDMGCAGNPIVRTPNLDTLASEGVHFARAYCANPICMPARTSLLTGRLPRDHGCWTNGIEMHPDLDLLPALLASAGYRTHAIGKLHLSRWVIPAETADPSRFPESLAAWTSGQIERFPEPYFGFQTVDFVGGHGDYAYGEYAVWLEREHPGAHELLGKKHALALPSGAPQCWKNGLRAELHYNAWIAEQAIRFLTSARQSDQPFFLWCSFPDPHEPYAPPYPYCDLYAPAAMPLPIRREGELDELPPFYRAIFEGRMESYGVPGGILPDAYWQEMRALTYGMITFVDEAIGRVLTHLSALGLRENTLVGFISDHGDMMGDHWMIYKGSYVFEGCARIPWIMALPHGARGLQYNGVVSQIDLLPTVLDFCRVPSPNRARLELQPARERSAQMAPIPPWPGVSLLPVLWGDTTHVRSAVVIQNDDPWLGLKMRTLVTERFKLTCYPGHNFGELFDLQNDPGELRNLWARPEWQPLKNELLHQLMCEDTQAQPWLPMPYSVA